MAGPHAALDLARLATLRRAHRLVDIYTLLIPVYILGGLLLLLIVIGAMMGPFVSYLQGVLVELAPGG